MTDSHTAFALTEEYSGSLTEDDNGDPLAEPVPIFQGGVLALPPDSRSYDVGQQLADGDGVIVVSTANVPLVELLRNYPALDEVPVPDGWTGEDDLEGMTKAMLQDEADRLTVSRTGTKDELVDRIRERRAQLAGAPPEVTPAPPGHADPQEGV